MVADPANEEALDQMRADWDERAVTNALYHVAAERRDWSFDDFYGSGRVLVSNIVDPALAALEVDPAGRHVLEIGCGVGRLFEGLAERFDTVSGIDISAEMVALGREHCSVAANWFVGDGATLSGIEDASVDHVISYEVFQHISDRGAIDSYLLEMRRVLRPQATFQIQLRRSSDTRRQAVVRALPRPLRRASASALTSVGLLPVAGDIDSWLGVIVPPDDAVRAAEQAGFVGVRRLRDEVHPRDLGYWLIGRRPADAV